MKINKNHTTHKQSIVILCALVIILASLVTPIVKASTSNQERKMHVKSIEIQEGDTLWSIAKEYYTSEYDSIDAYVQVIKASNNITRNTIHSGNYIIVPYYK